MRIQTLAFLQVEGFNLLWIEGEALLRVEENVLRGVLLGNRGEASMRVQVEVLLGARGEVLLRAQVDVLFRVDGDIFLRVHLEFLLATPLEVRRGVEGDV